MAHPLRPVHRRVLVSLLAFMAVSALGGATWLVLHPDGGDVMPISMMHGVFASFVVPGLLLMMLGMLAALAAWRVAWRMPTAWVWTGLATGGMIVWILVEIAILRTFHWLHAVYALVPLAAGILALPLIPHGATRRRPVA